MSCTSAWWRYPLAAVIGMAAAAGSAHAAAFAAAGTKDEPLIVFAAASLKGPLDRVLEAFAAAHARRAVASYAATSALARQIQDGAPAHAFFSADREWMDYLDERDLLVPGSRRDVLGNALVLIVPADRTLPTTVESDPLDVLYWTEGGRLAVAHTTSVPAGRYAEAALRSLGQWTALRSHLVETENVRAALALVARGEANAGLVYRTDALAEPQVRIVATMPAHAHPEIVYPVALVAAADTGDQDARALLEFLSAEDANAVFREAGFTVLAK